MKKRRLLTPFLSALLILSLLLSLPFGASAEETANAEYNEWYFHNSVVARLFLPEFRQIEPEDFPEVDCVRVLLLEKTTREDGVYLFAVLVLKQERSVEEIRKTAALLEQNPLVLSSSPNTEYEQILFPRLELNHSSVVLRLGETVDLTIEKDISHCYDFGGIKINFKVDRTAIDDSNLKQDSFLPYGIVDFWPCDSLYNPLRSFYPDYEGWTSEGGYYATGPDSDCPFLELVDRIVRISDFSDVNMARDQAVGTIPSGEEWKSSAPTIAEVELNKKIATVRSLAPGTTVITAERSTWDGVLTKTCTVTVIEEYQPGDVDRNLDIGAADALKVLQHSVNLITLDEEQQGLADMDQNGVIDTADALIILQITVGIL